MYVLKSIDGNAGVRTVHCARRVSAQLPGEPAPYVPTDGHVTAVLLLD